MEGGPTNVPAAGSASGGAGGSSSAPAAGAAIFPADNFFGQKGVDRTWTDSYTLNFNPSTAINDHLITFEVPRLASPNFMNVGEMVVQLSVKLVDKEGKKPEDNSKVAPVCLFGSSLFRTMRLFANEVQISSCEGMYPLRCYVDSVLNETLASKHGAAQLFGGYYDTAQSFQKTSKANTGFTSRRLLLASASQPTPGTIVYKYHDSAVPIYAKLLTDMTATSLPLLHGVSVRVELAVNEPSYYMVCGDNDKDTKAYKLKVEQATLLVPVKTMQPSLALDLERRLDHAPLHYSMRRVEIKRINIAPGLASYTTDSLTQSSLNPQRILLFFIPTKYSQGGYGANPFEFCNEFKKEDDTMVKLTKVNLSINGAPLENYEANTHDKLVVSGFHMLYKNLGLLTNKSDSACALDLVAFNKGYSMFLFDTTKTGRAYNTGAEQPSKTGSLRLEVGFSDVLPGAVELMVFSEYHSSMDITKNRSVSYNYVA